MEPHATLSEMDVIRFLTHVPIFSGIGLIEQKMLADKCVMAYYRPEEKVIEQGDIGDKLYIIVKGSVNILVKTHSMGWKRVNILNSGDVFGEIAILRNVRRTARVTTITACQFLTVSASDFLHIYQYFPDRARDNIQLVLAKRLKESEAHGRL
ncbi:MAG: cyclic nucleotide-binding protein [Legionella sp.]|nr:MAG: cyclic nucleotide-binding protein [Legionella sp.]PJD99189.1 MAG: cyclic nucleotide-binding protein [Legionella sp.]